MDAIENQSTFEGETFQSWRAAATVSKRKTAPTNANCKRLKSTTIGASTRADTPEQLTSSLSASCTDNKTENLRTTEPLKSVENQSVSANNNVPVGASQSAGQQVVSGFMEQNDQL